MSLDRLIQTRRLILRVHGTADFDDMLSMWANPDVVRFIGGKISSEEETWTRLLRYAGAWSLLGFGYWVIRDRVSGAFVGEVGFLHLHRHMVPSLGDRPELGFALVPSAQGKGLATEAAQAALRWGDQAWGDRETVCIVSPGNTPSLRVVAKLGYVEAARTDYRGAPTLIFSRRPTHSRQAKGHDAGW